VPGARQRPKTARHCRLRQLHDSARDTRCREEPDRAKKRAGADHILISATHTHTAPTCAPVFQSEPDKEYLRFLEGRIADGVARAIHNLAPAKIAWGVGKVPDQVFNRRWRMKPGTIPPNPFGGTNDWCE